MTYDEARILIAQGGTCSVCRKKATDAHHLNHKGMGGRGPKADADADDATPLCRECHIAHHDAGELHFRRTQRGALLWWATGKYAGRLKVPDGNQHPADERHPDEYDELPADDPLEAIGEPLQAYAAIVEANRLKSDEGWRESAEAVADALTLYERVMPRREARSALTEWAINDLGLKSSQVSRMLTVATHIPWERVDLRGIPSIRLYAFARSVRDGGDFEELAADALALSTSDFEAKWCPKAERAKKERTCPECGAVLNQKED